MEAKLLALWALYTCSRAPLGGVPNHPDMMNDAQREALRKELCQYASYFTGQDVPENYDSAGNWVSPIQH